MMVKRVSLMQLEDDCEPGIWRRDTYTPLSILAISWKATRTRNFNRRYYAEDVIIRDVKFRSLPDAGPCLKPGQISDLPKVRSGFQAAQKRQKELRLLIQHIGNSHAEVLKTG